jgi:hypothetical protein
MMQTSTPIFKMNSKANVFFKELSVKTAQNPQPPQLGAQR